MGFACGTGCCYSNQCIGFRAVECCSGCFLEQSRAPRPQAGLSCGSTASTWQVLLYIHTQERSPVKALNILKVIVVVNVSIAYSGDTQSGSSESVTGGDLLAKHKHERYAEEGREGHHSSSHSISRFVKTYVVVQCRA